MSPQQLEMKNVKTWPLPNQGTPHCMMSFSLTSQARMPACKPEAFESLKCLSSYTVISTSRLYNHTSTMKCPALALFPYSSNILPYPVR